MALDNTTITMHGNPTEVTGATLKIGDTLPPFTLSGPDLKDIEFDTFKGKVIILSVMPSVDTPVCALQTKTFANQINSLGDEVKLISVSRDLPFALNRFCAAEGLENILTASDYKYRTFAKAYGVDWEGAGLLARAVFVADVDGKLTYVEYVSEISEEPKYEEALKAVHGLLK